MVPKKSSVIIKITAEENDISEKKVDLVVTSFYKEVRKNLSGLQALKVDLPGLGYFQLRFTMVKQGIESASKSLSRMENTYTFEQYHFKKHLQQKLEDFTRIQVEMDNYLESKKQWKDAKAKGTLEKQKANSGGDNKLNS